MTVKNYLKTIPNNIIISTIDRDTVDERIVYLIDEYEVMIDEGYNLPAIDDTTTTGQLKDYLTEFSLTHPDEVRDLLLDFADKYLPNAHGLHEKRKDITDKQTSNIFKIWFTVFFSFLLIVLLIGGIVTGNFSFTDGFTSIMNFFSSIASAIIGQ